MVARKRLVASILRRSTGTAQRQPDHPEAQIPIVQRMRPAGSCMLGFRTLKHPKSLDIAAVGQLVQPPRNLPLIHAGSGVAFWAVVAGRIRYDHHSYRLLSQFVGANEVRPLLMEKSV